MLIGYARVSSQDRNLELQIEALIKVGWKELPRLSIQFNGSFAAQVALTAPPLGEPYRRHRAR